MELSHPCGPQGGLLLLLSLLSAYSFCGCAWSGACECFVNCVLFLAGVKPTHDFLSLYSSSTQQQQQHDNHLTPAIPGKYYLTLFMHQYHTI